MEALCYQQCFLGNICVALGSPSPSHGGAMTSEAKRRIEDLRVAIQRLASKLYAVKDIYQRAPQLKRPPLRRPTKKIRKH